MQPLASIPSPSQGVWHLGPLPLRAYALMIILGIVVAVWVGERRWTARGGTPGTVIDIAVWAVPFGLVGGRLYHVITDNQLYFRAGKDPIDALKIWNGGLGIWGAIALGAVGAWIGCRRRGVDMRAFADAVAPGVALAQAFGRWGNWFNQELYGRPLHTFWALEIDPEHRPRLSDGSIDPKYADVATYHPTFLYESLWCIGVAILVIWAGRRFKLNWGRSFALYVAAYTVGRGWIEALRIDNAHHFLGLRLNDYTSILLFAGAVAYMYVYRDKGDVEEVLETGPALSAEPASAEADEPSAGEQADAGGTDTASEPAVSGEEEDAGPPAQAGDDAGEPAVPAEPEVEEPAAEAEPASEPAEPAVEPDDADETAVQEPEAEAGEPAAEADGTATAGDETEDEDEDAGDAVAASGKTVENAEKS